MSSFIKKGKQQKAKVQIKTIADVMAVYKYGTGDGEKGNRYRVRQQNPSK